MELWWERLILSSEFICLLMEGKLPAVEFTDSLRWEGFDIQDGKAYADLILPTHEEAMKELALYAAEK